MTQEAFIKVLDKEDYSYEIVGDRIIVTNEGGVDLRALSSLSPGVEFRNNGDVRLDALTSLPPGVEFRNKGNVYLDSLKSLPSGVKFRNGGDVYLESFIGGYFDDWKGNIEGINSKRLLNVMIKQGVFL